MQEKFGKDIYLGGNRFGSLCGVEREAGLNAAAAAAKERGIFPG
jgi:hypothetical protein